MKKVKIIQTSEGRRSEDLSVYELENNWELINLLQLGWKIESTIPLAWHNTTGRVFGVIHILTIEEAENE